jgi:hypothetical protein
MECIWRLQLYWRKTSRIYFYDPQIFYLRIVFNFRIAGCYLLFFGFLDEY